MTNYNPSSSVEKSAITKLSWRLMPLLMVSYLACYIDRTNISFAALKMNADLGLDASTFGVAAGIFFLGYLLFEIPSNLACHKFGPRFWISRIMLTWGIISGLTAFAWDGTSLIGIRFLLGVAEAGFIPGVVLYLAKAFPENYRGRATGMFLMMVPVASLISSPLSTWLIGVDGVFGLKGWQLLFVVEAAPSILLAFVVFACLRDEPSKAKFLTPEEQNFLQSTINQESAHKPSFKLWAVLTNKSVLALGMVNFGVLITHQTVGLWLPQIIREFGWTAQHIGWSMAGLYMLSAVAMAVWGRRSDRKGERKQHVLIALGCACAGLIFSTMFDAPWAKFACLTVALVCSFASMAVILTIPTQFLKDRAAAGGIAMVVAIGSLSGFLGSSLVGMLRETTGGFTVPILVIAGLGIVACLTLARLPITPVASASKEVPVVKSQAA